MTYIGTARNIIEAFPIATSQDAAAVFADREKVTETMAAMLPKASAVYTEDLFRRATFPF